MECLCLRDPQTTARNQSSCAGKARCARTGTDLYRADIITTTVVVAVYKSNSMMIYSVYIHMDLYIQVIILYTNIYLP